MNHSSASTTETEQKVQPTLVHAFGCNATDPSSSLSMTDAAPEAEPSTAPSLFMQQSETALAYTPRFTLPGPGADDDDGSDNPHDGGLRNSIKKNSTKKHNNNNNNSKSKKRTQFPAIPVFFDHSQIGSVDDELVIHKQDSLTVPGTGTGTPTPNGNGLMALIQHSSTSGSVNFDSIADVVFPEHFCQIVSLVMDEWNDHNPKKTIAAEIKKDVLTLMASEGINGSVFASMKKTKFNKVLKKAGLKSSIAGKLYTNLNAFKIGMYSLNMSLAQMRKMNSDEAAFKRLDSAYDLYDDGYPFEDLDTDYDNPEEQARIRTVTLESYQRASERQLMHDLAVVVAVPPPMKVVNVFV